MKKKKLNWVAVGNLVGLVGSVYVILETAYKLAIEPLFTKEMTTLTPFGFIVLIVAIIVGCITFDYFEERLEN